MIHCNMIFTLYLNKGDGMLGLYTCAALREHGFDTVYCSGTREARSKFIDRFGGIPLYNGK